MTQVAFDDATHTYWINGKRADSVTTLIKAAGLMQGIEYADESAMWRGKVIHEMIRQFHENTLDVPALDPVIIPYLNAYMAFLRETGFAPFTWERRLGHPQLQYAGTYDLEGMRGTEKWLVDFKSGLRARSIQPWVGVQLAAYDILLGPTTPARRRFGLKLLENGTYNLIPFQDPYDYLAFTGCLNINNWRKKHE